jgi:four helix bundle protein
MSRTSDELRKRTKNYAPGVIHLFIELPKQRAEAQMIGRQILRSGTSVAANLREAARTLLETNELISIFVTMVKRSKATLHA